MKYESDWAPYFCKVNDTIASVFVDLGVRTIAPDKQKPELLWIFVKMRSVRDDGLPRDDEFAPLNKIEDRLTKIIDKKQKAINVGRVTTAGRREFYFFASTTKDFDKNVKIAMSRFSDYEYQLGTKPDPAWTQYSNFLYPEPQQYQSIQNMKVIENLEKAGDNLKRARNVSHWAYFKDSVSRENYIREVEELGFKPNPEYKTFKSDEDFPYGIMIERVDKVDFNSIDSVIIDLWHKAKAHDGDYDGWETSVEK
jgi:uncharacterized protein YaaR (DUF327 family)